MILSYSRPTGIVWGVGGTGAAFLTPSARLTNGRPSSGTRIRWLSGAQTTSSVLELQGILYPSLFLSKIVTLAGLFGVTLPVGTRIECILSSSLGTYTVETRVVERSDGTREAIFYFDHATTIEVSTIVNFKIYNDVYGDATIAADSDFEIGEAWAAPSALWCIRPTPSFDKEEWSKQNLSLNGQPFPVARRSSDVTSIEVTPVIYSKTWGALDVAGEATQIAQADLGIADLRERLMAFEPAVIVPMANAPFTGSDTVDPNYVNRHAQFGFFAKCGPIVGTAPRFSFSGQFTAPPALLP